MSSRLEETQQQLTQKSIELETTKNQMLKAMEEDLLLRQREREEREAERLEHQREMERERQERERERQEREEHAAQMKKAMESYERMFSLMVGYRGRFVNRKGKPAYEKGDSEKYGLSLHPNVSEVCYFEFVGWVKGDLGYEEAGQFWYREHGHNLFSGRKELKDDSDIPAFLFSREKDGWYHLYVVHEAVKPKEEIQCSGGKGESEEESDADSDVVLSEGDFEDDSDDDLFTDNVDLDVSKNVARSLEGVHIHTSNLLVGEEDEGEIDFRDEADINDGSEDEVFSLDGSDGEEVRYPVFNPRTDFKNGVKLSLGLKFLSRKTFSKALRNYAIDHGYNKSHRITVFCAQRCDFE
ncbi:uncharacterized protein [Spinacia oleracea]|uniref:PB1-like domain-containing protein n=1 Tax=Spinacia oleracea TaxID=3562 RepID=A0ABM3RQK4_SPIOL|nr:uncharacterized protein LOC130471675 [Spinacia oleracea]